MERYKSIDRLKILRYVYMVLAVWLCAGPVFSQKTLKEINESDYDKWYHLGKSEVSPNGKWIAFSLNYSESPDTLVIKEINDATTYRIPAAKSPRFIGDKWLLSKISGNSYDLMDLTDGYHERLKDVSEFVIGNQQKHLILFNKKQKRLVIRDLQTKDSVYFDRVVAFKSNPLRPLMAMVSQQDSFLEMAVYDLKAKSMENPIDHSKSSFSELTWAGNGTSLAYIKEPISASDGGSVGFFDWIKKEKKQLKMTDIPELSANFKVLSHWQFPLHLSEDGTKVFFQYQIKQSLIYEDIPEVWKADDPYIYSGMVYRMHWKNTGKIGMWEVQNGRFTAVTDEHYPKALISPNNDYALLYDPAKYEPQTQLYPPVDLYLMDLKTGKKGLLLKHISTDLNSFSFSPLGNYVLYFQSEQWHAYGIKKKAHFNLSEKLHAYTDDSLVNLTSYNDIPAGWSEDERAIYMNDSLDVWKIPLDKRAPQQLTHSGESRIIYRLITHDDGPSGVNIIKEDQVLYFSVSKGAEQGYAIKKPGKKAKVISLEESIVKYPSNNPTNKVFVHHKERFDQPGKIVVHHLNEGKSATLFQSNPHYKSYQWGTTELMHYQNSMGKNLYGILRYPVNYHKDSLYPMVVHVYQKQSHYLNQYKNPSMRNGAGFNPTNLMLNGYIVFMPDIHYTIGEPGFSALDCLESGTKKVMELASVDPYKIGLIGHSFGGYETLFAISHSKLFKTAIAGASIGSFPMEYLYLADKSTLNFYMYEHFQMRMGKSLFEDYQGYLDNSPLYHAKNIDIPLLLWSGKEDYHVNSYQSLSLHLAMKRLKKTNTLLLYPGASHVLGKPSDQEDLTRRVQQWFGYYLNGEVRQSWMPD